MPARLDPLIRVQKHRVEEKQKALARLLRDMENLKARQDAIQQQLEDERSLAEEAPDNFAVQQSYALFRDRIRQQIDALKKIESRLETRIMVAQDDMREAFAELKKVEIVEENWKMAEKKERLKKENAVLDEIGITRHGKDER